MISTETFNGAVISGSYMGMPFTGKVYSLERNQSGYKIDANHGRAYIRLDNALVKDNWTREPAGGAIIMDLWVSRDGKSVRRDDTRYTDVKLLIKKS